MPKVSLGIPFYGGVAGEWWTQMMQFVATLAKQVDIMDIITCGTMTADHSRNVIADEFMKSKAEWLFWIDSDTMIPAGAVDRLLGVGKTLVSGLYYGKNPPHPPIAYHIHNGAFTPIDQEIKWEKGEILPVDATGMGCMLTHRSVFEDIRNNFEPYQIPGGGIVVIHKNDIMGDVETAQGPKSDQMDGKVYKGQLRLRLRKPVLASPKFPYFMVEHQRTEDMFFFDMARRVGHKPWLDTSVCCGHLRYVPFTDNNYKEIHGH